MKKGYEKSDKRKSKDSKKPVLTEPFAVILKKMKTGKKAKLTIKTDDHIEQLVKQEQNDPKSHLAKLENQKQLIKLYRSNYATIFDDLKKDFENNKQALQTESNVKKVKEKISFSEPKHKKPKYGFEQFNKTSYVNSSCMKDFITNILNIIP